MPPPRKTHVLHPPLPDITLVTKIQDCMQLFCSSSSLFWATITASSGRAMMHGHGLGDWGHRCSVPCPGHDSHGGTDRLPQITTQNQSVALPEEDTPGEVTVTEGGDPEEMQLHTEASGKRSREISPTQTTATGPALSRSAMADAVSPRPSETPTIAKRARVAPDRTPPPACAVQGQPVNAEETATTSVTLASEPTRGSEGKEVTTLQIQIGPLTDQLRYQRKPHSEAPLSRRLTKIVADNASAGKATTHP